VIGSEIRVEWRTVRAAQPMRQRRLTGPGFTRNAGSVSAGPSGCA